MGVDLGGRGFINEKKDTKLFSNHSANLIEDWQDLEEDNIWK